MGKILKQDFANTFNSGETDLIKGIFNCNEKEDPYHKTTDCYYEGINPYCDYCGKEDGIRVVKREWEGSYNILSLYMGRMYK